MIKSERPTVVATQSANLTLALGASPIMATAPQEMEDLSKICGALLVNIGTLTTATAEGMKAAGMYYHGSAVMLMFMQVILQIEMSSRLSSTPLA